MIFPQLFPFDRFAFLGSIDEEMTFRKTATFSVPPGLPAGSIGDSEMNPSYPVGVTKLRHQYLGRFSQDPGAAVAAKTHLVHVARGAGTVKDARALLSTANGAASTVTIDIQKSTGGGAFATILTGTFTIPASGAAFTAVVAALDPTKVAYLAGDVFAAIITVAGGAVGQGLLGHIAFDEAPS